MAENCRTFIADKDKPFFLYFCTSDPHRGGGKRTDKPETPDAFGNHTAYPGIHEEVYDPKKVIVPSWMSDTAAARAELAEYYQSVSRVDQGIGKLVQLLKEAGQYDNTVFIYTSDNGIAMPGSKTTLYEPGMQLPLIVRAPDVAKRGIASAAMISWVDFTPTILDFAGVKEIVAPPLQQGEPEGGSEAKAAKEKPKVKYTFHGRSFRPTLEQEKPEGWNEVFASHTFHEVTMYYPMRVVRTDRYKLILNLAHPLPFPFASDLYESAIWQRVLKDGASRYGKRLIKDFVHRPRYELYDLKNDPDEVVNLAEDPKHAATFNELAEKLKAFQKRTRDPWVLKYQYE
jgi:N-sulfoglucosamine sulfohydrolase